MQKITPFLWFNGNAEMAVKFYRSVFKENEKAGHGKDEKGRARKIKSAVAY
jgi:predicted 3-demethylubiquinone-9 3-methyltransferase (glyoxalase superfamily)